MFESLVSLNNLFFAWDEFKKGKQQKPDVMIFERHLEDNIFTLHEELITEKYKHQPYYTFHIYDPKFRIINKATVCDRVVHHLCYEQLEKIFQPTFIYHSYSCQNGKGVHLAVENMSKALRKISKNYTVPVWSLKMDMKKFFASVDQKVLLNLLKKRITDDSFFNLLETIISAYRSDQGTGRGMSIGNLTSQIFANIYLSPLDNFAKHVLHEKYYFRYADDFLFLHTDRTRLEEIEKKVIEFALQELHLIVHPNKIIYRKFSQGIDWLGYVLLPHYRVLRTSTKRRMFKKMHQKVEAYNSSSLSEYELSQSLQSYLGMMKPCQAHETSQELMNRVFFEKDQFGGGNKMIK